MSNNLSPIHAAIGILMEDNKFLVCQRPSDKSYSGYWEFPGGKLKANESSVAALKRELAEEIGVQVITCELLLSHVHSYFDKSVLLDVWWVEKYLAQPVGKENQTINWVSYEDLLELNILAGSKTIITKLKTHLK